MPNGDGYSGMRSHAPFQPMLKRSSLEMYSTDNTSMSPCRAWWLVKWHLPETGHHLNPTGTTVMRAQTPRVLPDHPIVYCCQLWCVQSDRNELNRTEMSVQLRCTDSRPTKRTNWQFNSFPFSSFLTLCTRRYFSSFHSWWQFVFYTAALSAPYIRVLNWNTKSYE